MSFHIIGDQDTILGFRFAGVPGTAVDSEAEARTAFEQMTAKQTVQILILTHSVADMLGDQLVEHRMQAQPPYIVEIGDIWETPVERQTLEQMIQEAVGIRIMKDK